MMPDLVSFFWRHSGTWTPTRRELDVIAVVLAAAGLAWAALLEPYGTVNDGLAWDGRHYIAVYWHFAAGTFWPIIPSFPYFERIGVPFVAAQFPLSPWAAFVTLHVVCWTATMVLFVRTCRECFGLGAWPSLLGVVWVQILWTSIPRNIVSYPFQVDSASLLFIQAWIYVLFRGRHLWWLPVIAIVGTLCKEAMVLVVLLSFVAAVHFPHTAPAIAVSALGAFVAQWVALHAVPAGPMGSAIGTMLHWYTVRTPHLWMELARYLTAIVTAYGGFVLLWLVTLDTPRRSDPVADTAVFMAGLYLGISFFAGTDLTRFAYTTFPWVLPVFLRAFAQAPPAVSALAFLLGLPAANAITPIPPPALGNGNLPNLDLTGLYSWMMEYAHPSIVAAWLAWWVVCGLVLRAAVVLVSQRNGPETEPLRASGDT